MVTSKSVKVNPKYSVLEDYLQNLTTHWDAGEGKVIYKGRNELREMVCHGVTMVVKEFRIPNIVNRLAYGVLRPSKAARSYEYAHMLLQNGIGTPEPVGYYTERNGILFGRSFYACLKSECPYTYVQLMNGDYPNQERVLQAIARLTARIHELGWIHKDYSRGNILFKETPEEVKLEIIDLNRIRFQKIDMEKGCKNFERLPGNPEMLRIMADEYAKVRGFDAKLCYKIISTNREK
jgi:tRNA A-37 threonylcarbamoyl transferase component Bud32